MLLNQSTAKQPAFFHQKMLFTRVLYNKKKGREYEASAGGGDWDGDGISDYLLMPSGSDHYKMLKGRRGKKYDHLSFDEDALNTQIKLHVGELSSEKASRCAWAWDYTGTAKARGVTEYIGIAKNGQDIALFELSERGSRLVRVLHEPDGKTPHLTAGDLNRDGKMDIVFSCGFGKDEHDKTKIYVMYGKLKNIVRTEPSKLDERNHRKNTSSADRPDRKEERDSGKKRRQGSVQ